jgi:hypothetical protein
MCEFHGRLRSGMTEVEVQTYRYEGNTVSNDKSKFYDNDPRRQEANRGYDGGGNDSRTEVNTEKHGQKRGVRIAQGGSGGADGVSTGKFSGSDNEFALQRECGGNKPAEKTRERHASDREQMGSEFVSHLNGRANAKQTLIPNHIQIDDRGLDSSGNCSKGGQEPALKAKRATTIDMSTKKRFHDN